MSVLLGADPLDLRILDVLVTAASRDEPPEMLYHYTDFEGLKGIVATHSLWATHSRALNDSSEQRYGEQELRQVLLETVGRDARERIRTGMAARRIQKHAFVSCFCENSKLLSMWREYGRGGGGYCIGFDSTELRALVGESTSHIQLAKVVYGEPTGDLRGSLVDPAKLIERDLTKTIGFAVAGTLAAWLKHPSFREEQEWRLVAFDSKWADMEFRQGSSSVIPYIELRRPPQQDRLLLPIREVICGPTLMDDEEVRVSIEWMLAKYGYAKVKIERSDIPYRL